MHGPYASNEERNEAGKWLMMDSDLILTLDALEIPSVDLFDCRELRSKHQLQVFHPETEK